MGAPAEKIQSTAAKMSSNIEANIKQDDPAGVFVQVERKTDTELRLTIEGKLYSISVQEIIPTDPVGTEQVSQ